MLGFNIFLNEEKAKKQDFGSLGNDPKGKLHELLVGYHLNGGKHMEKHPDENGLSPKELHDEIIKQFPGGVKSQQYKNFSDRAKKAAEDIKQKMGWKDGDIAAVHHTSQAGDIERTIGIPSSQQEDDSDIMVTDKNGKHHGITLKVSDDNKPITLSNNGADATYGGDKIIGEHKKDILNSYPELSNLKNDLKTKKLAIARIKRKALARGKPITAPDKEIKTSAGELRKAWLESDTNRAGIIKQKTQSMLKNVVNNMHGELQKLTPEQLAHHVRHLVLHAYSTPKEAHGHTHTRHFTGGGFDPHMDSIKPGEDYEHFLSKPENIRTRASGANIYYEYEHEDPETGTKTRVPFAMQSAKLGSSDPMGSLVVTGRDVKRKQDESIIQKIKEAHKKRIAQTGDTRQVRPDTEINSKDIQSNSPNLNRKMLSDFRPKRTQQSFQTFIKSKAKEVQNTNQQNPFQKTPNPGIQDHRQHVDHTVGGFHFRDREQQ